MQRRSCSALTVLLGPSCVKRTNIKRRKHTHSRADTLGDTKVPENRETKSSLFALSRNKKGKWELEEANGKLQREIEEKLYAPFVFYILLPDFSLLTIKYPNAIAVDVARRIYRFRVLFGIQWNTNLPGHVLELHKMNTESIYDVTLQSALSSRSSEQNGAFSVL